MRHALLLPALVGLFLAGCASTAPPAEELQVIQVPSGIWSGDWSLEEGLAGGTFEGSSSGTLQLVLNPDSVGVRMQGTIDNQLGERAGSISSYAVLDAGIDQFGRITGTYQLEGDSVSRRLAGRFIRPAPDVNLVLEVESIGSFTATLGRGGAAARRRDLGGP